MGEKMKRYLPSIRSSNNSTTSATNSDGPRRTADWPTNTNGHNVLNQFGGDILPCILSNLRRSSSHSSRKVKIALNSYCTIDINF